MTDVTLDDNPVAALPLTGDEILAGIQDDADVQMTVDDILAPAVRTTGNQTIEGTKSFADPVVVPTPTAGNHAVPRSFVDALALGGAASSGAVAPVKVVSTSPQNIGLASGLPVVDGYQIVENDRVLLTGQTSAVDDGPWVARGALGWVRPDDFAVGTSQAGMAVFVAGGNTYKGSVWVLNSTGTVLVGTNAQTWAQDATAVRLTGNQTIAGTKTFSNAPLVPDNSWSISDTAGLDAALAGKANDNAVVKLTGAQNVGGVKTFTSSPVVPDGSWSTAKTTGLQAALDAKALDAAVVKTSGNQSKAGDLTLTGQVIVKADGVFDVRGYTDWDPIAANNDVAFAAALIAAGAAGGGRILLPRLLKITNRHEVGNGIDVVGLGSRQGGGSSEVRCTGAAAGVAFGNPTEAHSGGVSGGFWINAASLATEPFYVGIAVGRTFHNIDIEDSAGTGSYLQGTANCTFIEVNSQGAATDACRCDRIAGNAFYKCEYGNAGRYQLALVADDGATAIPFGTNYPMNNAWYASIFEYHESSTVAQVYQGAGINNMLSDCNIATDATPVNTGLRLVKLEQAGVPFSTNLRLRDCTLGFNFSHASTVGVTIGDGCLLIATGNTSLNLMGTGFQNAANGRLEADRVIASSVTTLRASTGGGVAYMRIRPDINDPITCTSVTGINKALPVYDASGVFLGYVAVGSGIA